MNQKTIEAQKQRLIETNDKALKCIHDFFGMAGLSPATETIARLLTCFSDDVAKEIENEDAECWKKDYLAETTRYSTDVIIFLTKLYELNDTRDFLTRQLEEVNKAAA